MAANESEAHIGSKQWSQLQV